MDVKTKSVAILNNTTMYLLRKNICFVFMLFAVTLKMVETVDDFLIEYMKFNESLEGLSAKITDMENTIVSLTNRLEEDWSK